MPVILFVELNSVYITFSFSIVIIILKNIFCKIKWRSVKCFLKEFYVTSRCNSVCADETKSYEHFSKLIRVDRGHILIRSDEGLTLELETIWQRATARNEGLRKSLSRYLKKSEYPNRQQSTDHNFSFDFKMTSAQVFETSVAITDNCPSPGRSDYTIN